MGWPTILPYYARLCPCAQSAGSLLQRWVVQRAVRPEGAVYERTLLSNGRPFISLQVLTEISSARNRPDKADYSFDGFGTSPTAVLGAVPT